MQTPVRGGAVKQTDCLLRRRAARAVPGLGSDGLGGARAFLEFQVIQQRINVCVCVCDGAVIGLGTDGPRFNTGGLHQGMQTGFTENRKPGFSEYLKLFKKPGFFFRFPVFRVFLLFSNGNTQHHVSVKTMNLVSAILFYQTLPTVASEKIQDSKFFICGKRRVVYCSISNLVTFNCFQQLSEGVQ